MLLSVVDEMIQTPSTNLRPAFGVMKWRYHCMACGYESLFMFHVSLLLLFFVQLTCRDIFCDDCSKTLMHIPYVVLPKEEKYAVFPVAYVKGSCLR